MEITGYFYFFQFEDQDYFTWADRQGIEHPLIPTKSSCNLKNPAWESDQGEVNDIKQLPITNIKYGPMGFELAKVEIIVGPIVCQPSENALLFREQIVADQIEALKTIDRVFENKTETLKTNMTENSEKIQLLEEAQNQIEKVTVDPVKFEVLGKHFYTDKITRNFDDAQAFCKKIFPLGGRLYEPRDETTNEEIIKNRYKPSWIGITDRISQGSYLYESDNGQLTISPPWHPGQPNRGNQRCVRFCESSKWQGKWCDQSCFSLRHSICERTY